MKKRLFAMLLALVMIVSVLPLAAFAANENDACQYSTNGQHNWNRDTGKCTNYRRVGNSRQYCNAQCTHAAGFGSDNRCNTCDFRCTHKSSNGTSRFNNGVCSNCQYHCTHPSVNNNRCTVCRMTVQTCTHPEYKDGKCTKCGKNCPHDTYVAIPEKAATCTQTGTTGGTWCAACHTVQTPATTVPMTGHQYTEFVSGTDATCDTAGYGIFKCSTCNLREERVIPAGHALSAKLVFVKATCANKGVAYFTCSKCDFTKLDWMETLPHTEVIVDAIPATCTATGLTEGLKCSVCNETLVSQEVIEKLPHEFSVTVEAKKATCTTNGYNAHLKCATCDETMFKEETHLLGHNFVNYICTNEGCGVRDGSCLHENAEIIIVDATCKAAGEKTFNCPTCGDHYEITLPKLTTHSYVNGKCSVCGTTACVNHRMEVKDTVKATCTTDGYVTKVCAHCGKVETEVLTAKHNYVNNICTVCGQGNASSNRITIDLQDIFVVG